MRIQQSFTNEYSRLQQKRYGSKHPQLPWLVRHREAALAALCIVFTAFVILTAIMLLPAACDKAIDLQQQAAQFSRWGN